MKKVTLLLIALLLSSCASMRYGNFSQMSQHQDAYLAADATAQLARVYPPTQNSFCIGQKAVDGFGIHLIHDMQKKGYDLPEHQCHKQKANFFYVLDEIEPHSLYRVSLFVRMQTLSRVYAKNHEELLPISAWTYKE